MNAKNLTLPSAALPMFPNLNIRQKILLGFAGFSICLGLIALFAYANLVYIDQRVHALGKIDELEHSIVELRREGKIFLFYGEQESYNVVLRNIADAATLLRALSHEQLIDSEYNQLQKLQTSVAHYRSIISAIFNADDFNSPRLVTMKSVAHDLSMELEDRTLGLSESIREQVNIITGKVRYQLFMVVLAAGVLFLLIFLYISNHVFKPLKIIEETTKQIARGNFKPVEPIKGNDEIRQLQEAFNRMVLELKSRQEQLVQSQKLSSIGTLSAGIAHQVNNPLNNISTSAQILGDGLAQGDDETNRKMLGNIEHETVRARDIIRGLLDFSRKSEVNIIRTRLKDVVDSAVRFASSQVPASIELETDIPEDLELELDPQRMAEALLNMILNAVDAIGNKPGKIRLYMDKSEHTEIAALVVEDNGCGIAPEDVSCVFDPFFTRKQSGKGTGLGLSVGYGIIEECGGKIQVKSAVGQGTRFTVFMPVPGSAVKGQFDG